MESPIKSPLEKLGTKPHYAPSTEVMTAIEKSKQEVEFSRYKQDCRKRSMDLAHTEYQDWYRELNSKSSNPGTLGEMPNIVALADKYYNWLISIPQ